MTEELKQRLQQLADKFEVSSFCDADPSQFLRWYDLEKSGAASVECASFIAAMLAFGNRKQFIPKIQTILELADQNGGIVLWCKAGAPDFPRGEKKFYRFYSYDDMHCLFGELALILNQAPSLGDYFKNHLTPSEPLYFLVSKSFPDSAIVPRGQTSANKRIHMFLRWMVRRNSPVDLGLWTWADPADLLIPLDVHVMQEAVKLGLLPANAKPTKKTALQLTNELSQAFPGDPSRGDFALFGLGVYN